MSDLPRSEATLLSVEQAMRQLDDTFSGIAYQLAVVRILLKQYRADLTAEQNHGD